MKYLLAATLAVFTLSGCASLYQPTAHVHVETPAVVVATEAPAVTPVLPAPLPEPVVVESPKEETPTLNGYTEADVRCMAQAIYFESKSEPEIGMRAVGFAVLNRVKSGRWRPTVCGVVNQCDIVRGKRRCQFSWKMDGKSDTPSVAKLHAKSLAVARDVLAGRVPNPVGKATSFHNTRCNPRWRLKFVCRIGGHLFYA